MAEKTVFERIRDREIPAQIEYEDEEIIAFHDAQPQAPVHLLIVPKKAYPTLEAIQMDDLLMLHLLQVARRLAAKMGIQENYRLLMNVGRQIQAVHHVHLHLLGGWACPEDEA